MSTNTTSNFSTQWEFPIVCLMTSYGYTASRFILVVPLCIFILYQAFQQWRQQHSFSTTSHSDLFTFQTAAVEMSWVLGVIMMYCSDYGNIQALHSVGDYLMSLSYFGQGFFHMLTCVERYLAVIHPITYRGLKNSRGVLIRNISIGSVWFLSFVLSFVFELGDNTFDSIILLIVLGLCLFIISYCSVSILCVLNRPGPGDGGGDREHVDQLKIKVFFTIIAILGATWLWFGAISTGSVLFIRFPESDSSCAVLVSMFFFNLPSNLVSPLLYLHRTGRLACRHSSG